VKKSTMKKILTARGPYTGDPTGSPV